MAQLTLNCIKNGWTNIDHPNTNYSSGNYADKLHAGGFFLGFEQPPASIKYRPITSLTYYQFITPTHVDASAGLEGACAETYTLLESWAENAVTYYNSPKQGARIGNTNYAIASGGAYVNTPVYDLAKIKAVFQYGIAASAESVYSASAAAGARFTTRFSAANKPYLTLEYGDENSLGSASGTPTAGYLNPAQANVFRFTYAPPTDTLETPSKTGVKIRYKYSENGEASEIDCGNVSSYSVPANTFTAGTLYWQVVISTDGGDVESPWYTVSTNEPVMSSSPKAPRGTIEDGSAPIAFSWYYYSSVGSLASKTVLQWSTNGSTWNTLATVDGYGRAYTAPAGTFPAGTVYWRTQAYNASGVAGTVSAAASFTCVAAPETPSVTVDAVPFATVDWTSIGQQAYQVFIDGEGQGIKFGAATSYTLQDYLEDGEHTIAVAVQGEFGLWSEQGTATVTIENVPGDDVRLAGTFGTDALLMWGTAGEETSYIVYRDSKQIGTVEGMSFTDRLVLGPHEWFVVNVLPGGYYTKSNVVEGTLESCETVIDTLANPSGWMALKLSANSDTSQRFSYTRTSTLRHFKGAALPLLEQSSFEDGSGSYDVSFASVQEAMEFEAFKGKVVIIKSRGGSVVIGALNNLEKVTGDFFISYTFTVQRIFWEDFINGQNG